MYNYSEDEKEILKVLKMQESNLDNLSKSILTTSEEIRSMTKEVNNLSILKGVDVSEALNNQEFVTEDKISTSNIPLWDAIASRADNEINYQPVRANLALKRAPLRIRRASSRKRVSGSPTVRRIPLRRSS